MARGYARPFPQHLMAGGVTDRDHDTVFGLHEARLDRSVALGNEAVRETLQPPSAVFVHSPRVTHHHNVHGLCATDHEVPRTVEGDYLRRTDRFDYIRLALQGDALRIPLDDSVEIRGEFLQQKKRMCILSYVILLVAM